MTSVESVDDEILVSTADGAVTIGPVAIALGKHDIAVRDLTLRTTTLDDVFLELTGSRIQNDEPTPTEEVLV